MLVLQGAPGKTKRPCSFIGTPKILLMPQAGVWIRLMGHVGVGVMRGSAYCSDHREGPRRVNLGRQRIGCYCFPSLKHLSNRLCAFRLRGQARIPLPSLSIPGPLQPFPLLRPRGISQQAGKLPRPPCSACCWLSPVLPWVGMLAGHRHF